MDRPSQKSDRQDTQPKNKKDTVIALNAFKRFVTVGLACVVLLLSMPVLAADWPAAVVKRAASGDMDINRVITIKTLAAVEKQALPLLTKQDKTPEDLIVVLNWAAKRKMRALGLPMEDCYLAVAPSMSADAESRVCVDATSGKKSLLIRINEKRLVSALDDDFWFQTMVSAMSHEVMHFYQDVRNVEDIAALLYRLEEVTAERNPDFEAKNYGASLEEVLPIIAELTDVLALDKKTQFLTAVDRERNTNMLINMQEKILDGEAWNPVDHYNGKMRLYDILYRQTWETLFMQQDEIDDPLLSYLFVYENGLLREKTYSEFWMHGQAKLKPLTNALINARVSNKPQEAAAIQAKIDGIQSILYYAPYYLRSSLIHDAPHKQQLLQDSVNARVQFTTKAINKSPYLLFRWKTLGAKELASMVPVNE